MLQRARQQDDYLHFHPEADQLQAGQLRLQTSQAPYTSKDVHEAVRALDEAPDGWRMLDWSGQGLEALAEVPASFQHVRVASVADNKMSFFPAQLTALTLLQRLNLSNNSLSEIPYEVGQLQMLREMRATDNSITVISAKAVEKLSNITLLDLRRNQLQELPASLAACKALNKLFVSKNRLRELPATLTRLQALTVLRADRNEMVQLGFQVGSLSQLQQLWLGHNKLTDPGLPPRIGDAPALTELALSNNLLETLPPSLGRTPLKTLHLHENPLKRPPLQIVFKGTVHVQKYLSALAYGSSTGKLALQRFQLTECPLPTGRQVRIAELNMWELLSSLSLEGNVLTDLPVEIAILSRLRVLDVQYNKLAVLPPSLGQLRALQVLDAASNVLHTLPESLAGCTEMAELLLENNRMTEIPQVVAKMHTLRELRLSSNRISTVPDLLSSLEALTYLDLEHNRIVGQVPAQLSGLLNLHTLKLGDNHVSHISPSLTKLRFVSHDLRLEKLFSSKTPATRRRQRMLAMLNGSMRPSYRTIKRLPEVEQDVCPRPPGAGNRRGWALVRCFE